MTDKNADSIIDLKENYMVREKFAKRGIDMEKNVTIDNSIRSLGGIGTVRAAAYAKLGVYTIYDLLNLYPRAYENRGNIKYLTETLPEEKSAVILTVSTEPKRALIRKGMSLLKFRAFDDSAVCEITFFNQDFLSKTFPVGSVFRFWGKVERKGARFFMSSPMFEPYTEDAPPADLYPLYRLTEGLSRNQINSNIAAAMSFLNSIEDPLPNDIRTENRLCTYSFALKNIHAPDSFASLTIAKRRLIFDEFFTFAVGMNVTHKKTVRTGAPVCSDTDISDLLATLPYELTNAQKRVIDDIRRDMAEDIPMSRMLVGDVGCGKTVCAAAAIVIAVKNGYQAALMVPTEILAQQHYADMRPMFEKLGIKCELLTGSTTASNKKRIYASLAEEKRADGRTDVVIGTHALLSDGVRFSAPGLVITDEQHRFGVAQRATLSQKNSHTHMLVISATPIPRSLALVMYGNLDISKIDEMPSGRQRVDTFVVDESYRERLDKFIVSNVSEGGQVYIVCPAVEEKNEEDEGGELNMTDIPVFDSAEDNNREKHAPLKAATQYAEELSKRLSGISVAFVHGKMKSAEKEAVMNEFSAGKIQVLVSTTVIEVGVNVPNACLMIVENAERFGMSQLHQLRGRVGRGSRRSYCVLVKGGEVGEKARKRLETMRTTYDGYTIAEQDLELRGPGDFLAMSGGDGIRQSGGLKFKLADMCDDSGLMRAAFSAAREFINETPSLDAYPALQKKIESLFSLEEGIIN